MARQVVVVVDLQNDYFPGGKVPLWNIEAARDKAVRVVASAREEGTPVIHVRHEFPDAGAPFFVAGTQGADIHETILPDAGEDVIVKNHANSFRETQLREVLDAHAAQEVVIVGAMSHMCIDATARAAADLGYEVVVLHDAVTTLDLEFGGETIPAAQVHGAFLAALAQGYARIQSVDEHLDRVAA